MVLSPAKVGVQSESASILRTMNGTVYLHSPNGNIVSHGSNNQLPKDSLESAPTATNENVSMRRPNSTALVVADGATCMQSSSFVAHTLFQNQTNAGNIFDHPSEEQEPPPKSKKIISPFAPEATVPLPDLLPCCDRRLSKVDTLRLAIYYIRHLDHLLCDSNHDIKCECFAMFGTEDLQT